MHALFPLLRFIFLEISMILYLQKTAICLKLYFITHITSCVLTVYIYNGMKVKKDSGCSSIEYDIYFEESESLERK